MPLDLLLEGVVIPQVNSDMKKGRIDAGANKIW